ncbi:hypothetical protein KDD17_08175 [Sulfitobacter albidus]|uniref:DNA alkylation repair protein n=1 Tax=Sulfitobacter albidus TaxID=2829501 RepID=A0A975JH65_9RHOB|nr:hypothetical protein [Sulfitobacter albidus]QUJ77895.1 hypothetical protein KDD17_08175 [Sulfitobacter albidus]
MADPLKDQLFNARTVGTLAAEFAAGVPGFDADRFARAALGGFAARELMARIDWMADCAAAQLSEDFPTMADQITASLPARLDPALRDDDFGQFIHATHGVLAVRHGLEQHRDRALDLIYAVTQRFTMEFAIRPFLNRWPEETLARMRLWAEDGNYHVRRLVSEGTRPRLPWGAGVALVPDDTLPLLDVLHADPARFVTRSVANHLNDLTRVAPDAVLDRLAQWQAQGAQDAKELAWMTRHALRTLIKQGHPGAMAALGYRADLDVTATLTLKQERVTPGEALTFDLTLEGPQAPVIVDYRIRFARPTGRAAERVFKLKTTQLDGTLSLHKSHPIRQASTFQWHSGAHLLTVQVNGRDVAQAGFDVAV